MNGDTPENPNDMIPEEDQGLVSDFFTFLKEEKIWWILPLIIILAFFAIPFTLIYFSNEI